MRSFYGTSMAVMGTFLTIVAAGACNTSSSTVEPATPEASDVKKGKPADSFDEPEIQPESEATAERPSGEVDLPPPSASAWNTGQSDGKPGKADRGIKDYQRIIGNHRERFRSCYDAALAKDEGIKGRVTLVWVLDPNGAVREGAHIDPAASDIEDEFLETCLVSALNTLTFPPSKRGMDSSVRYPFQFNPRSRPRR